MVLKNMVLKWQTSSTRSMVQIDHYNSKSTFRDYAIVVRRIINRVAYSPSIPKHHRLQKISILTVPHPA